MCRQIKERGERQTVSFSGQFRPNSLIIHPNRGVVLIYNKDAFIYNNNSLFVRFRVQVLVFFLFFRFRAQGLGFRFRFIYLFLGLGFRVKLFLVF
jgi:hypothetical protein